MKNMEWLLKKISGWSVTTRMMIVVIGVSFFSAFYSHSQFNTFSGSDGANIANANANIQALMNQLEDYQDKIKKIREAANTIRSLKNASELIDLAQAVYCAMKDINYLLSVNAEYEGFDVCSRQFQLDLQVQRLEMALEELKIALGSNKDLTTADRMQMVSSAMNHLSEANDGLINLRGELKTRVRSRAIERYMEVKTKHDIRKIMSFSIYEE